MDFIIGVGIICFLFILFLFMYRCTNAKTVCDIKNGLIAIFLTVIVIGFALAFINLDETVTVATNLLESIQTEDEMIAEIEENAESITFYLDGSEISYGNIDIQQYDFSYDKEAKKVFMTHKKSKGLRFLPFFIPYSR